VSVLRVRGLSKRFGAIVALDGIDFDLSLGERVAVIGPNGAGKSTFFNILGGQLAADEGTVLVFDRPLPAGRPGSVWRAGVGRTFQIAAVFSSLSVLDNIALVLLSARRAQFSLHLADRRRVTGEAMALLARVGMADQADRQGAVLAYGDLKRLELAMALASGPRLLLMDEPTAGMAPAERGELMRLVAQIADERQMTVVFTEHDMDVVFAYASRIVVLHRGRLLAAGTPEEVRGDPRVRDVYLGGAVPFTAPVAAATDFETRSPDAGTLRG
jgi:branched-chain amino acid transport system ATP-binding protein